MTPIKMKNQTDSDYDRTASDFYTNRSQKSRDPPAKSSAIVGWADLHEHDDDAPAESDRVLTALGFRSMDWEDELEIEGSLDARYEVREKKEESREGNEERVETEVPVEDDKKEVEGEDKDGEKVEEKEAEKDEEEEGEKEAEKEQAIAIVCQHLSMQTLWDFLQKETEKGEEKEEEEEKEETEDEKKAKEEEVKKEEMEKEAKKEKEEAKKKKEEAKRKKEEAKKKKEEDLEIKPVKSDDTNESCPAVWRSFTEEEEEEVEPDWELALEQAKLLRAMNSVSPEDIKYHLENRGKLGKLKTWIRGGPNKEIKKSNKVVTSKQELPGKLPVKHTGKPKKVKKGLSEGELKDLYAFVSSLGDIGLKDPLSFILSIGDQKTEKDDGKDRKDVHSNKTSFTFEAAEALVAPVTKMFYGEPSTEGEKKPESKAKSSSPAPAKKSNSVTTKTIPVTTTTKEPEEDKYSKMLSLEDKKSKKGLRGLFRSRK